MKITKAHYNHMKEAIATKIQDTPVTDLAAYKEALKTDTRVKDINVRFRWDLFHAAKLSTYASKELYSYCNDNHIDTALKAIMKELGH